MLLPGESVLFRRSQERGFYEHGWLKTYHTFSFADYYDPKFMGFHALRVINEDYIDPGRGFAKHPHKDMEIFTYVVEGALRHQDSMGNASVIRAGEVQKMTAGSGIFHSEYNFSDSQPVHLYQIWILPNQKGLPPTYQQFSLNPESSNNSLVMIGSSDGGEKILKFHQDIEIYRGFMKAGGQSSYSAKKDSSVWVQVIAGSLQAGDFDLNQGDGLGMNNNLIRIFKALTDTEFLVFELKR